MEVCLGVQRGCASGLCHTSSQGLHKSAAIYVGKTGSKACLPDTLGFCPSAAGGQGATISTFPRVPLRHEPTCTQANDLGASGPTVTPANTSRPSRCPGHFPNFLWSDSPWLANGSPHHVDWFLNPTGLLLGAFCRPISPALICSKPRDVPFPFATSRQRRTPHVPWFPGPKGLLRGPCHTPFLVLSPHPIPFEAITFSYIV